MPNPTESVAHVDIRYRALDDALEEKADFQFLPLNNDFGNFGIPEDRRCRSKLFYIIKMSPFNNIDNNY